MSSFKPHATPQRPLNQRLCAQGLLGLLVLVLCSSRLSRNAFLPHMLLATLGSSFFTPLYPLLEDLERAVPFPITGPRSIQAGGRWGCFAQRLGVEDLLLQWQRLESVARCGSTPEASTLLAERLRLDSAPSRAVASADKESL